MHEGLVLWAQREWPAPRLGFLVVVNRGGTLSRFASAVQAEACGYADDIVSELDPPDTVALVLDAELRVVHEGRHYARP